MQTSDLRIGNYVMWLVDKKIYNITGILNRMLSCKDDTTSWHSVEEYKEIPLTNQFFLNNGFTQESGTRFVLNTSSCLITAKHNFTGYALTIYCSDCTTFGKQISSVHEYQNALHECNIKDEVIL